MLRVSLDAWLAGLPPQGDGHLLIGAAGHLSLSSGERQAVAERLRQAALPSLIERAAPRRVTLVTGLAPGADLLFKQVASQWLTEHGIAFETVALLPVPVPVLIEDWVRRLEQQSVAPDSRQIEEVREEIATQLARCAVIVELLPRGLDDPRLTQDAFRTAQYRRLAACLAEQSDVLVAILRPGHHGLPGGAAEVVDWRQCPSGVPAELSTLGLRRPTFIGQPLVLIDPAMIEIAGPPAQPDDDHPLLKALAECRAALKAGNYLLCHDLATRARADGLRSRALDYVALLSLANAGSTQLAMLRLRALDAGRGTDGSDGDDDDYEAEEWLALNGRLLKDLALAAPPARAPALFFEAGLAYARAFAHAGGYFPGINAATMLMLGGHADEARLMAQRVLDLLATRSDDGESDRYYQRATEAEAALLLGDSTRARAALVIASGLMRGNVNAHSRTRAQLRLICRHLGRDEDLIDLLALPPVLFVADSKADALNCSVLPREAAFVCAALNGPRDLMVAEHYQQRAMRVHLVLPMAGEPLLARWRQRHGAEWASRLARCLDSGVECSIVQGFLDDEDDWCAAHISATACGLSRLEARRLGTHWQALGGEREHGVPALDNLGRSGTAADGTPMTRRFVGTLFADFAGYSRISDAEQPLFQSELIGAIAAALRDYRARILLQHTWGDAVHIVAVDAETIAQIAERIHCVVEARRRELGGTLATLELRLSAHFAPVFEGVDPVEERTVYFGSQFAFAARIEPVTPPGMIFVTEAFAARLMLEAPDRYAAEYAGEIDLPKAYGKYRLYSMRRGGSRD